MTAWPGRKAAEAADQVALHDHLDMSASSTHEILAKRIWTAMYDLGAGLRPGGQWMTLGLDAETFAGIPASLQHHHDDAIDGLIGKIPATTRWPPRNPQARRLDDLTADDDVDCDVTIFNAPNSDVDLHTPERRGNRLISDSRGIAACLDATRPGGMFAAVLSTDWLDSPNPRPRKVVADHTDLIGAVRLPAATLRKAAGTDRPVDLLLLRRRPHDWQPQHGATIQSFQNTYHVPLDKHRVRLNEYFDAHPEHVLGRLTTEHTPWSDTPRTTVLAEGPHSLNVALELALARIVHDAHRNGLGIPFGNTQAMRPEPDSAPDDAPTDLSDADRDVIRALRAKRHDPGPEPMPPENPTDMDLDEPDDESPSL